MVLILILQATVVNATGIMRGAFYSFVDVWLPYFVASRALRDIRDFREFTAAFALAVAVMAPMAIFEAARSWLIYDGLGSALGLPSGEMLVYITRGESGLLRANVAAGNSIVLGYLMMVAIALLIFLARHLKSGLMRWLAALTLGSGLMMALSRGPWVGAALALVVGLGMGPGVARRYAWMLGGGGLLFALVMLSPFGAILVDHLPFVGTVDEGSVTYRQRLLEVSLIVLWQNPMFGSFDYIVNPIMEEMRQGQGIIDIVNTYLAVALAYGLVGLCFFVAPFLYAIAACWRAHRIVAGIDAEAEQLGRAVLAAMVGILVTIATVSSITFVPTVYWLTAGVCVAYARRYGQKASSLQRAHGTTTVDSKATRVYPRTFS